LAAETDAKSCTNSHNLAKAGQSYWALVEHKQKTKRCEILKIDGIRPHSGEGADSVNLMLPQACPFLRTFHALYDARTTFWGP
jgi:hypothetical protein